MNTTFEKTVNTENNPTGDTPSTRNRQRLFERLILPLESTLYAPAMSLTRSASDAEDLVQETLLRAFDRFETYRSDGSPKAWLHTIMRNLFFNIYRKKSREPKQVSLEFVEPTVPTNSSALMSTTDGLHQPALSSPERIVLSQMESDAVLRAVRALPAEYREVVMLSDLQGLPYQEIAEKLEIPIGTVRSRLSRGRDKVRRALFAWRPNENENMPHPAVLAA